MYRGSEFVVDMYSTAAGAGPGDSSLLAFVTSPQIMAKLAALIFANYMGFFYVLLYLIMVVFLTFVLFNATLIYMSALIMIGLLVSLAPIFIAFYLFDSTKSFFENWLKQMIGYAIQIIIISAGILFIGLIIRTQIYNNLGYGVCLRQFPDMNTGSSPLSALTSGSSVDDGSITSLFAWWFPVINTNVNPATDRRNILVPKAYYRVTSGPNADATLRVGSRSPSNFCEAYQCTDSRYPDLPFLDPDDPYEARIMRIMRDGTKVDFWGLFILVVCCYLLHHFNETTTSIAKFLSSTTGNLGDNTAAARGAFVRISGDIVNYGDRKLGISKGVKRREKAIHDSWTKNVTNNIKSYASKTHYARLERQALRGEGKTFRGGANTVSADVLRQVSSKYGLSQADAREYGNNKDQYKKYVGDLALSKSDSKALLKALDKGDLDKFGELAKKHNLSDDAAITSMSNAKSKELRFKKAYVDSYRDLVALKEERVAAKSRKKQERAHKADRNIASLNNLKRYLTGNVLSSEADEILYQDSNLMTTNERIAQKEERLDAKARKKMLNKMTIEAGKDVQRLDYVAERRAEAEGNSKLEKEMNRLDNLVKAAVSDNLRQALIEGVIDEDGRQSGTIKGDTYVRTEMNDSEFDQMISDVRSRGQEIMLNDDYIDNADLYTGDGAAAELETRKSQYGAAIEDEVGRLNDVRFGDHEEPASFQSKFKESNESMFGSRGSGGSDSSDGGDDSGSGGGTGPNR
jgi:type IV secretion system protein VirB6